MADTKIEITISDTGAVECTINGTLTKREFIRIQKILKIEYRQSILKFRKQNRARVKEQINAKTRKITDTATSARQTTKRGTTSNGRRTKTNAGKRSNATEAAADFANTRSTECPTKNG